MPAMSGNSSDRLGNPVAHYSGVGGLDLRATWTPGAMYRMGFRLGLHVTNRSCGSWCGERCDGPEKSSDTLLIPIAEIVMAWEVASWGDFEFSAGNSWSFNVPNACCGIGNPGFSAGIGQSFRFFERDDVALGLRLQVDFLVASLAGVLLVRPSLGLSARFQ